MSVLVDLLQPSMSLDVPDVFLWCKDLEGNYVANNLQFAGFVGFKNPKEVIGISDFYIRSPASELADLFQTCDKEVADTRVTKKFFELLKDGNGQMKILLVTKVPILNENQEVIATFGHGQDITRSYAKLGSLLLNPKPCKKDWPLRPNSFSIKNTCNPNLTRRQAECLFFFLRHKTTKDIANILKISIRTVHDHLEQLKDKFFCQTKNELMEKTLALGFFNFIPESIFNDQLSIALEI